jgi:hypothetical protein
MAPQNFASHRGSGESPPIGITDGRQELGAKSSSSSAGPDGMGMDQRQVALHPAFILKGSQNAA